MEPKKLRDKSSRKMARNMRNQHWLFMEKIAEHGVVWFCPWDKFGKHKNPGANEVVDGLTGWGILEWTGRHKDWFKWGSWSYDRCARPVRLTPAGIAALENWHRYDMEPVYGGLVEPGWQAIPTPLVRQEMSGCQGHPDKAADNP